MQEDAFGYVPDFYLLDAWTNDLEDKLLKRVRAAAGKWKP